MIPIDAPESDYLYTEASQLSDAGLGLHTAIPIFSGEIIDIYKGEILTDSQASMREQASKAQYFIQMLDGRIMDSANTECFAKYANDAKGSTDTEFKNNAKIAMDDDENICLIATRNIRMGEEIFCSYGKKYWKKIGKIKE